MKRKCSQERFPRGIEALAPLSAHAGVRKTPDAMDRARRRARERDSRRLTLSSPLSSTRSAAPVLAGLARRAHVTRGPAVAASKRACHASLGAWEFSEFSNQFSIGVGK